MDLSRSQAVGSSPSRYRQKKKKIPNFKLQEKLRRKIAIIEKRPRAAIYQRSARSLSKSPTDTNALPPTDTDTFPTDTDAQILVEIANRNRRPSPTPLKKKSSLEHLIRISEDHCRNRRQTH